MPRRRSLNTARQHQQDTGQPRLRTEPLPPVRTLPAIFCNLSAFICAPWHSMLSAPATLPAYLEAQAITQLAARHVAFHARHVHQLQQAAQCKGALAMHRHSRLDNKPDTTHLAHTSHHSQLGTHRLQIAAFRPPPLPGPRGRGLQARSAAQGLLLLR